ncbi:MAG: hypothetical protein LBC40_03365, partial [Dysgonamonadaceae bacterium]|nr:hypothetical protein [Dysgonamonadaceae bacterium]
MLKEKKRTISRLTNVLFTFVLMLGYNEVCAQRIININEESTAYQVQLRKQAMLAGIPQDYRKEAKAARAFALNPALQRSAGVSIGDNVRLQLFEGDDFMAQVSDKVVDVNGTLALTLKLPDYPLGFAIITTSKEGRSLVTISIPELGRIFGSRYGADARESYLIEVDESKIERPHDENDAVPFPEGKEILEGGSAPQLRDAPYCGPTYKENVNDPATVDLLIVYTSAAASSSYASSHGGINNVISSMISLGNTCMTNSNTGITLRLAHSAQVDYTETDMYTSLEHLSSTNDGYMDNIHALRKEYKADLVQLLSIDTNYGGLGYTL